AKENERRLEILKPDNDKYIALSKVHDELAKWIRDNSSFRSDFSKFTTLKEDKRRRLVDIKKELQVLRTKITENLGIESPSSASLDQKRKDLDNELERINSDKSAASNNIRNGNNEINEINQNIILLSDKNQCPLCKQPLTGEHMSELKNDYMKRIEELRESSSGSENFIRAADLKISKIKRSLSFINSDVGGKLASFEKNESDIENELNSLSRQEDKVKSDYESFTSADKKLQESETDLKRLEPQWRNYMGLRTLLDSIDIKNLEERITSDNLKVADLEEKNLRISSAIGYLPIKSDLEESGKISTEIESIRIKVEGVEEKRKNLINYREELEKLKANIDVKKGDIKMVEENISAFGNVEGSIKDEKNNFDTIRDSITRIDTKIKSQNDEMIIIDERIKNSGIEITKLQKMKKALNEIEVIIPAFRRDGIPRLIRVRSSQFITDMTTEIMSHFNLSVEGVKVTEDLDIEVFQNGSVKELQQLSGGERTAVAIALRMAMARYLISNISVLLMDEPTNFLDEDRRNDLKDIIKYSLRDEVIVPQLIVITHHSELTTAADVSYTVESKNGFSNVTPS
ncbi:MAG: hypothetical protein ACYDDC_04010, partial [Thermoplasmataceae archaeon]